MWTQTLKNSTSPLPRHNQDTLNGTTGRRLPRCQESLVGTRCGALNGVFTVRRIWKAVFLSFKHDLETEDVYEDAKLLVTLDGAIVGWATVSRDERWRPATAVLDLFFHPNFADDLPTLLSAVKFPDVKVQCYVDSSAKKKASVLEDVGFTCEGQLKNQFEYGGQPYDVLVFARG